MSQDLHLENIRREYSSLSLSRKELPVDPLEIVRAWIDQAIETKVNEPTANSRQPTRCPYFPLARTRATDPHRRHDRAPPSG